MNRDGRFVAEKYESHDMASDTDDKRRFEKAKSAA